MHSALVLRNTKSGSQIDVSPKGICPMRAEGREETALPFAFLNCLAGQACVMLRAEPALKTVIAAHTHRSGLTVGLYPTNMDYVKGS